MTFRSRDGSVVSLQEALFTGLAADGGLFHPVERPSLSDLFASFDDSTSFQDVAAKMCHALFAPDFGAEASRRIASRAFDFQPVLRRLDERILLLEFFHGPTCAFKDFGAQFLAACLEHFAAGLERHIQILVATSGDTGSAVAKAFHGKKNIDVVILYPCGRVSELQEKQLTTLGGNVHALEIDGSFDDCQRLVKQAFGDAELRRLLTLTSANSINIGRLLPQSFSYVFGATRRAVLGTEAPPVICVPSGNFGNLTAGVYAWHWGLPVRRFIAATNINDVVPRYLAAGIFAPRASVKTLSNAMDVGNPSNFDRLVEIFGGKWEAVRSMVQGAVVTDQETRDAMREVHDRYGVYVDPHTAVGYVAARNLGGDDQVIVLSTAHASKFREIVEETVGAQPEMPKRLAACLESPKQSVKLGKSFGELSAFLKETFV